MVLCTNAITIQNCKKVLLLMWNYLLVQFTNQFQFNSKSSWTNGQFDINSSTQLYQFYCSEWALIKCIPFALFSIFLRSKFKSKSRLVTNGGIRNYTVPFVVNRTTRVFFTWFLTHPLKSDAIWYSSPTRRSMKIVFEEFAQALCVVGTHFARWFDLDFCVAKPREKN